MGQGPLVAHVVGARPNYMKVAPLYSALASSVDQCLIHTGQHYDRELNEAFFAELPLPAPDVMLSVGSGSHGAQTAAALAGLERELDRLGPQLVVVPGDVNSTLAGALAAVKLEIPVCHLEAGLRSFDWSMPEEHNRRLADHLSTILFTHSLNANENLAAEGIAADRVSFVGNTMIDTLFDSLPRARELAAWRELGLEERSYVLVTLHRPALVDSPELLRRTLDALAEVSRSFPVVFPLHPRTRARLDDLGATTPERVVVTPPLPYHVFVGLESAAAAVITDSGGVQEETTALGVPCFTLRDNTERPVTITHGTNSLLGLDPDHLRDVPALMAERTPAAEQPLLWDGHAGARAARVVEAFLGVRSGRRDDAHEPAEARTRELG